MSSPGKTGTTLGSGYRKPCRDYPGCNHRKHGYTRKDRPAPNSTRAKPTPKSETELKAMAADHVCWCRPPVPAEKPLAGEIVG